MFVGLLATEVSLLFKQANLLFEFVRLAGDDANGGAAGVRVWLKLIFWLLVIVLGDGVDDVNEDGDGGECNVLVAETLSSLKSPLRRELCFDLVSS